MKIVQINSTCGSGSIGKICKAVSQLLTANNIENYILYTLYHSDYEFGIKCGNAYNTKKSALKARLFGNYGFNAFSNTKKIIKEVKRISPDIVHIHNIHSHDCNFSALFDYLKLNKIKVFYTFHDCWAFTGYCMYFDIVNCEKWKNHCYDCPQKKKFSWFFDKSSDLQRLKKEAMTDVNLTIVTPSEWLASLTKESFLKKYPVIVVNNGIDLSIFRYRESNFRKKYNIEQKFVLLGVAMGWESRKGLESFIRLANDLDDSYKIVLVGTNKAIEKKLPNNIISINRTENQIQLAEIYSSADLFIDPTMEDNYPTTHLEAIACGTPVLTYNSGGSAEMINEKCGIVVERGCYDSLLSKIKRCKENYRFVLEDCVNEAKSYSQDIAFQKYVDLYSII